MKERLPYYNRGQRIGIAVLVCIMLLQIAFLIFYNPDPNRDIPKTNLSDSSFFSEVRLFEQSLKKKEYDYDRKSTATKQKSEEEYETFHFDPNALDSVGYTKLGFTPFVARNIIRYRQGGGKFKHPDDLYKIYAIDSVRVSQLLTYITINRDSTPNLAATRSFKEPLPADYYVGLNTADSTELKRLPHVGSRRAAQILYYKRKLGGYYSADQIREACDNLTDEELNDIASHITIDENAITKIPINRSSVKRLREHPYISFYQAKAIYEYRWNNGGTINSIERLPEFSKDDLKRLTPYLDFSIPED